MTKYYAVDVRGVTDTTAWYEQMESLGFNFDDHSKKSNFIDTYWFYFDEHKYYCTYLCEGDCNYSPRTGLYEYDNDFDGACQWFIDHKDNYARLEEFQLSANSFYYGQL